MKYAQIIFSPTGGTKAAAEAVTARWDGPVETVDLCTPPGAPAEASFAPEDLALIAMPSYGGRVPALAAERLGKLQGNGAACVLLCVYGNRAYEDTLAELQDLAERQGFRVFAAIAAVAESFQGRMEVDLPLLKQVVQHAEIPAVQQRQQIDSAHHLPLPFGQGHL